MSGIQWVCMLNVYLGHYGQYLVTLHSKQTPTAAEGNHGITQEIDTHCMTAEGRFVNCSSHGGLQMRLGEGGAADNVEGSEVIQ